MREGDLGGAGYCGSGDVGDFRGTGGDGGKDDRGVGVVHNYLPVGRTCLLVARRLFSG